MNFDDPYGFMAYIESNEGKYLKLTLEDSVPFKEKSIQQLGYFWGYLIEELRIHIGYETKDQMYNVILGEFSIEIDDFGNKFQKFSGVSELSTVAMNELCSRIRVWASEFHGLWLKMPGEIGYDFELND